MTVDPTDAHTHIDSAIANLTEPAKSGITFRQGLRNNWTVLKAEAIPMVKAIASNLLN